MTSTTPFEIESPEDELGHITKYFEQMEQKYEKLVWYARKGFKTFPGVPQEIIDGAKNQEALVEEMYPEEIDSLKDPRRGDWTHGFNSGMLASMRFVLEALSTEEIHEEDGEEFLIGGLENAKLAFPELDT